MESSLVPSVSSASHFETQEILTCNAFRIQPSPSFTLGSGPSHPPWFGATFATLFSRSFDCAFEAVDDDGETSTATLPLFIEKVVFGTGLPFRVTIASLILLQRMYTRLPMSVFDTRGYMSPKRLFLATYILAAKQHTQLKLGVDLDQVICAARRPLSANDTSTGCDDFDSTPLSDAYWTTLTRYSIHDIRKMQQELIIALGGAVAVFPQPDPNAEEMLKQMEALPVVRELPGCAACELEEVDLSELNMNGVHKAPRGREHGYYPDASPAMDSEPLLSDEWSVEEIETKSKDKRLPNLPSTKLFEDRLPNLSRMTPEAHLALFRDMGEAMSAANLKGKDKEGKTPVWWMRSRI